MQNKKLVNRVIAFWVIVFIAFLGYKFVLKGKDFKYGLDLNGGTSLTYVADLTKISVASSSNTGSSNIDEAMDGLRDVIEKRVNLFGVGEPVVRTDYSKYTGEHRLVVELPGITDIDKAIKTIGDTPNLEFKLVNIVTATSGATTTELASTGITGNLLDKSILQFDGNTNKAQVGLNFNDQGKKLFADLTKNNVGKQVAIYLDGNAISSPMINGEIPDGKATISGNFTTEEAKLLVQRLNSGALPVPVKLASSEVIGAELGDKAKADGLMAVEIGLLLIAIFMII
jgi:preprotein translocase subunit SecD